MSKSTRRASIQSAAAIAAVLLAASACGSSSKAQSATPKVSTSASSASTAEGGHVTVALGSLPTSKGDPFGATYAGPAVETWAAMFDALTETSPKGATPALATGWSMVNPTTWQFNLRQGVTFSDGEPFNAAAAAATFDYLTTAAGKATAVGGSFQQLAGATAVSPYVLDVMTKAPDPVLPQEIVQINMVAPQAWQRLGPAGFASAPVGTGPFQVTNWGPTSVSLSRFAGSWRTAHYRTLTITQIADPTARYQALESGQAQVDYDLALEQLTSIKGKANLSLLTEQSGKELAVQYLMVSGSPLLNQQVRQALSMAVDRQAIVSSIFDNLTTPAYQGASEGDAGYDSALAPISYDPTKAKSLLAQAGYPNGFSIEADVASGSVAGDTEVYEAVTGELAKAGVTVKFVALPYATWLQDFLSAKYPGQATSIAYSDTPAFDAALALDRGSCLQKPAVLWCQPDQAAVLTKINSTTDIATRTQLFDQVQQMERTNPPALFLYNIINATGVAKSVHAAYLPIGAIDYSALAPA